MVTGVMNLQRHARTCSHPSIQGTSFFGRNRQLCNQRPPRRRHAAVPVNTRPRCSAAQASLGPFKAERELQGVQKSLAALPSAAFYAVTALSIVAVSALGFLAGDRTPANMRNIARPVGALLLGGVATLLSRQLAEQRGQAAGVELYNHIVRTGDASSLTAEQVSTIGQRFGVNIGDKLLPELQAMYGEFVESLIPPGDTPLSGEEPQKAAALKLALGLEDKPAAEVHINLARRFLRERAEAGKGGAAAEQRKAFNKLVYVSYQVFGHERASWLLPFTRTLNINPNSIDIANREVASSLFSNHIAQQAGAELQADREVLMQLKQFQQSIHLSDELAAETLRGAFQQRLVGFLDSALESIKRRGRQRSLAPAMQAIKGLLEYNKKLEALATDPDVPKGVGRASVHGTKFTEGRSSDMRLVYTTFLEETLRLENELTAQLDSELTELQLCLALGNREAQRLRDEITSKAYRRLLREEFTSGRLDEAPSKAAVLQSLCDRLRLNPEVALALHKSLYRQRLDTMLEKKALTDEDSKELDRLRKLMCLQQSDVDQLHRETSGRQFQQALSDALAAGVDRFTVNDRDNVRRAKKDLRISDALAKDLLSVSVRKAFLGFITRSRSKSDQKEAAKELKQLVYFSNLVVTSLLEDVDAENMKAQEEKLAKAEAAKKELADLMAKAAKQKEAEDAANSSDKEEVVEEAAAIQQYAAATKEQAADPPSDASAPSPSEASGNAAAAAPSREVTASNGAAMTSTGSPDAAVQDGKPATTVTPDKVDGKPSTPGTAQNAAERRKGGEAAGKSDKKVRGQKEINLGSDLELSDRQGIYRNYLLYCMTGETVAGPLGASVTVRRDESEFVRLSQLGDILGLNQFEVAKVHGDLAEQAYRGQVQQVMASGTLNKESIASLNTVREKMGLSKEAAEKIVRSVQNQRMGQNLQAAKAQGALTLEKVLEMKDSGIDISTFVSPEMRLDLFRQEIQRVLSEGKGDFDAQRLLEQLPKDLGLQERRVKTAIEEQARERKRSFLVQSVSFLRQRKLDDTVKALNNLLACNKALPSSEPARWSEPEELQDLYCVYVSRVHDEAKQADVQQILGVSEEEARSLQGSVAAGTFRLEEEAEEETAFF